MAPFYSEVENTLAITVIAITTCSVIIPFAVFVLYQTIKSKAAKLAILTTLIMIPNLALIISSVLSRIYFGGSQDEEIGEWIN